MMSIQSPIKLQPRLFKKLMWLLILATLWAVTLVIIPKIPTSQPAIDSKVLALRVMLCAIFVTAIVGGRQLLEGPWRFLDTIWLGVIGAYCLATAFSGSAVYSLTESWHLGGLILVGWIISRLNLTAAECRTLLWTSGALGVVASLYGILTYIGVDVLRPLYPFEFEENQAGGRNYIHSFFGNPEYFGGYAAPTAVILWGLAFQPTAKLRWRFVCAGLTGFVLLVLGLSGSRGAFLGFIVGAVIVFLAQVTLLSPRIRKVALGILVLAVVVLTAAVAILSVPNPLNRRDMRLFHRFTTLTNTQTASVRERLMFYTSTVAAIPENPVFGYGPATYRLEFLNNVKRLVDQDPRAGTVVMLKELDRRLAEHAHNDYLEIWFEQGTLGLGAFLLLLTYGGVRFIGTRFRHRNSRTREEHWELQTTGLYVTTFAAVVTICINAATSFPLHMPARATLVWFLIGAFFALDQQLNEAPAVSLGIRSEVYAPKKDEI